MEQIGQVLQSYFRFRNAVLRTLAARSLSKSEFELVTGLDGNSKYRRENNPALWKPSEVGKLASYVDIGDGTLHCLQPLARLVAELPETEKKQLAKVAKLTPEKIWLRQQNVDYWQAKELDNISSWLKSKSRLY
jgi:hypothetical protein